MIWSVHSFRCRKLYLLIVPFFSNSLTRSQWMSFCRSLVDFFAPLGPAIAAASSGSLASSSSSSTCLDVVEKGRHLFFVLDEPLAPESNKRYYMTTWRYWGGRTCYFHMWRYVFAHKPTLFLSTNFFITLHFIQKWLLILHHFSGSGGGEGGEGKGGDIANLLNVWLQTANRTILPCNHMLCNRLTG